MANHKSAIKRHRQSLKRRDRNRNVKSAIRSSVKEVHAKIAAGDTKGAQELLRAAERLLSKASVKGILHPRNASRRISRLASQVSAKSSAAPKAAAPAKAKKAAKAKA